MSDRNNKGQFVPGNKASPGRPKQEVDKAYLDVVKEKVTLDEWADIVTKIIDMAKSGNFWAIRWLSDYLLGKPEQTLNLGSNEDKPLKIILEYADVSDNSGHSPE